MHAQQEVSFLVMGHAKTDTGKKREIKRNEKRPVRELQSPPRGFMVVERAHGKVNQESCSPLLSTLNSSFFFFFSWSREAPYLPNLVGLSNAHFLAFVWLDKVGRPRKSCEGAEAWCCLAREAAAGVRTPVAWPSLHRERGSRESRRREDGVTKGKSGYRPAPRLVPAAAPWDSTPQTR